MRKPNQILMCVCVCVYTAGCGDARPLPDDEILALANAVKQPDTRGQDQTFDFGQVLARGQVLTHEFTIRNLSSKLMRIRGVEAFAPCCSAIKHRPDFIAPGGTGVLAIEFRPGIQTGSKTAVFRVASDDEDVPLITYSVQASVYAEIEIQSVGHGSLSIRSNEASPGRFRVISRRLKAEGVDEPIGVSCDSPCSATFVGAATTVVNGNIIENTRDVEVSIPASATLGDKQSILRLQWAYGIHHEHAIYWRVVPAVTASPESLVLSQGAAQEKKILLTSSDRTFRILSIAGNGCSTAASLPTSLGRVHSLTLLIDPAQLRRDLRPQVLIETDNRDAPVLKIDLFVAPKPNGEPR